MPINRRTLKSQARDALRSAAPSAVLMTLVYFLLTTGVSRAAGLFVDNPFLRYAELVNQGIDPSRAIGVALAGAGMLGLFLTILLSIYNMVVDFGYLCWCLNTSRSQPGELGDLIGGFSMPGRVILLQLVLAAYYLLWYFAIFIPALLLGLIAMMFDPFLGTFMLAGVLMGALALYVWRILRYSLAPLCLADDPEAGVGAAIRRSRALMEGNCGSYLLLRLSFFGWYLLLALIDLAAAGIVLAVVGGPALWAGLMGGEFTQLRAILYGGVMSAVLNVVEIPLMLWLYPYISVTKSRFYSELRSARPAEPVHYRYE